jgi:hypothetical protein
VTRPITYGIPKQILGSTDLVSVGNSTNHHEAVSPEMFQPILLIGEIKCIPWPLCE